MFDTQQEKITLCDFTAGFIQGRLARILEDDVRVEEINCQALKSDYCEFRVELD